VLGVFLLEARASKDSFNGNGVGGNDDSAAKV